MILPWEEACLCDSEKEADGQQPFEVMDGCCADCDDTPAYHDPTDPNRRREAFHSKVARRFEEDVGDEEDGDGDVVTVAGEIELVDDVVGGNVIVQGACVAQVDLRDCKVVVEVDGEVCSGIHDQGN